MAELARLTAEHAPTLAGLEFAYPEGMRSGLARLHHKLGLLQTSRYNFGWVLMEGSLATAYLIAYPSKSLLDVPDPDFVIYIDDLQVLPGRTGDLYRLLKALSEDLEEANLAHLHVEALCRRSAYKVLVDHPQVIRRVGYEMLGKYEYWEDQVGEELCWIRWAPIESRATRSGLATDVLHVSQDMLEELQLEGY